MKLLLDINIFMDMLFERDNGCYAKQIIQSIQHGIHEAM